MAAGGDGGGGGGHVRRIPPDGPSPAFPVDSDMVQAGGIRKRKPTVRPRWGGAAKTKYQVRSITRPSPYLSGTAAADKRNKREGDREIETGC